MFQIMKLGEQVFTPFLEITLLQLEVLYKLQKKLELNSTMPLVFSWMETVKSVMLLTKMEIK